MTLKHILYTSTAALAMAAPTLATSVVANAATGAPAQTTQTAKNDNKQANQANDKNAGKTNDNKAASTAPTSTAPAKANSSAANTPAKSTPAKDNTDTSKATPAKTDATQPVNKIDFGSFKASTSKAVAADFTHKAPRYTGSSYTDANKGYTSSVTATQNNSTLNYQVSTYDSNGNSSNEPFAVKIYKNGSLYKTFTSTTGAAKGSLNVDKGTYTIQVLTSASAHYTGGLSLS